MAAEGFQWRSINARFHDLGLGALSRFNFDDMRADGFTSLRGFIKTRV